MTDENLGFGATGSGEMFGVGCVRGDHQTVYVFPLSQFEAAIDQIQLDVVDPATFVRRSDADSMIAAIMIVVSKFRESK